MNYDTFEVIHEEIEEKIDQLEKAQYTLCLLYQSDPADK